MNLPTGTRVPSTSLSHSQVKPQRMASLYEDLADDAAANHPTSTTGGGDNEPSTAEQAVSSTDSALEQEQKDETKEQLKTAEGEEEHARPVGQSGDHQQASENDVSSAKPETSAEGGGEQPAGEEEAPLVFVGGLAWSTTEAGLKMYFEQFGEVKQIDFKRGFAFVHFQSKESAQAAIEAGSQQFIDGRRVEVKVSEPHLANRSRQQFYGGAGGGMMMNNSSNPATMSGPMSSSSDEHANNEQFNQAHLDELQNSRDAPGMNVGRKVFVGGLAQEVREPELKQLMEHHGTIEDVVVMIDKFTKRSRGFGFVTFSSRAEAEAASKHRRQILGGKQCEVKLYEPGAKGNFYHQRSTYGGPSAADASGAAAYDQSTAAGGAYQHQQPQEWTSHRPFNAGGGGGYRGGGGRGGRGGYQAAQQQQYGGYYSQPYYGGGADYSQQAAWGAPQQYGGYPAQGGWYGQQAYGYAAPQAGGAAGYNAGGAPAGGGRGGGYAGGRGGGATDQGRPPYRG